MNQFIDNNRNKNHLFLLDKRSQPSLTIKMDKSIAIDCCGYRLAHTTKNIVNCLNIYKIR